MRDTRIVGAGFRRRDTRAVRMGRDPMPIAFRTTSLGQTHKMKVSEEAGQLRVSERVRTICQ